MIKRYLYFLMLFVPLTAILQSGSLYAQTDAEYEAALAAIVDGSSYYITTEVDDVKYYLDANGYLTSEKADASIFIFKKIAGSFKGFGFYLDGGAGNYFSNPVSSANIDDTKLNTHTISGCRNTWDAQVFFLNANGKYAVRATNAASASSGWGWVGNSYWAVKEGPIAGYSFDVNYIWSLESPSDKNQVMTILNSIFGKYENQVSDTYDDPVSMNIGTEPGQLGDIDTWHKLWTLLQEVNDNWNKLNDEDYDYDSDPNALSAAQAYAMSAAADSMYQKILDSEIPYSLPNGDGYYRIISRLRYSSNDAPSGYVDKALSASISSDHLNKGVYATVNRDRANFIWKLTQHGDSILIQNAGMDTYVSFSSPDENCVVMTTDANDAAHLVFDYVALDLVENDETEFEKDLFYVRLANQPRGGGNYLHQLGHNSKNDTNTLTGNSGTDSGKEMELSFWAGTYNNGTDKGTSEWYLEFVPEDEAQSLIEAFAYIRDHDVLVEKNNALRAKVNEALLMAKDSIRTNLITDVAQMTSPFSYNELTGRRDGGDLSEGVLIDGDKSTYWHSSYDVLSDVYPHYIQLSGMKGMVGNCELYLCQRAATNDHPKEFTIVGSNDPEAEDADWVEMAVLPIPNVLSGEENTVPFFISEPYEYVRLQCTQQAPSNRNFWHAAELQIMTVSENPNSQFASLGDVAVRLDQIYHDNIAVTDDEVTPDLYEALFNAYEAFLKAMVDPTELRDAMAKYATLTKCVVEGNQPGQWTNTDIATAFDALYKEVQAYDDAGRYTAAQNHKYAVILKSMAKTVMEGANGVKTDVWYHILFPTEAMYTDYGFDPKDPGGASKIVGYPDQFGYCVAPGVRSDETAQNDEGEEAATGNYFLQFAKTDDIREGMYMYFADPEELEDKDVSLFRFIERETDASNYTPIFKEVKENMLMALDMSTTYTKGEPLITDASQLSSNAPDPQEGLHIEYACDGNPNTFWHSDYHSTYLEPAYLQVALNQPVSGLIQVDVTRRQNSGYGHIVRMYIQGSNDAENWNNVGYLEVPYTTQNESVTTMPVDLGGTYSHLRFTLTQRVVSGGGLSPEFDPFAVITSADQYDKEGGWTYFHVAEFQIYPVTPDKELSANGKALQQAYTVANKVLLKDATAQDYAAASKAYKTYQSEFNLSVGKAVLPDGLEKAAPSYAIQNKATGLFVNCKGARNANNSLELVPTFFNYKAIGFERSLIRGTNLDGGDCSFLHSQNFDHRFVTWDSTEPNSNSGLVIREVEPVEPADFTFTKDIRVGKIYAWCYPVTLTPEEGINDAIAYTPLGQYEVEDEGVYLALKEVELIEPGQPTFYIYGDTTVYAEEEIFEPVKFTIKAQPNFVYEGSTVNGAIGSLVNHTLKEQEIYFSGNYAKCIGTTGYYLSGPCVALSLDLCPKVDPEANYDFSIFLGEAATSAEELIDGIGNIPTTIQKISQPGDVYSIDGKLLRTNATLNTLKSLGKGMYILNGVRILVK